MLPPPPPPKRGTNVSIRFNSTDYARLKQVADYRGITVTALLHYVVVNSVIPKIEKEMQTEQRQVQATSGTTTSPLTEWLETFTPEADAKPVDATRGA